MLELTPLFRAEITLAAPQELGEAPLGRRRIIPITGGSFRGERLSGRVVPGGADWQIVRRDGAAELDARYTLETSDGALVYVHHQALRHGPPEVLRRLAEGKPVDRASYYMRGAMRFETGDARYEWLNRTLCATTGARLAAAVELEVYEIK
jgi:hypothetical protein